MQSLHIKVTQIPPNVADKPPYQWNMDDLQIIEQFFESRVSAPPYRPNALSGFARMLNVPSQVLKDFIQVGVRHSSHCVNLFEILIFFLA